jgi:pantoate--beta-alanine ligase
MDVIATVEQIRAEAGRAERPLGLVPTMGFLHEGHMSLVRLGRSDSETLAASIFVNPAQFGPQEDLASYPRDMDSDLAKLEGAGVDLVFAPSVDEMYPEGFDTYIDVGRIGERLEGEARPGHFRGVATVVCKLLAVVRPDRAYFGQKDAQQGMVVRQLSRDLNLGADIVVAPTVREPDGLALSSRNAYLGTDERRAATVLRRALLLVRELATADAEEIRARMRGLIEDEPLAMLDYVSVADAATLDELEVVDRPALVSLAVRIGRSRLIDNIVLQPQAQEKR